MTTATILADNGVSSGSSGLKTSGGNDGTLVLQTTTSGGTATTAVTIDTSQNTTMAGYLNAPNTFGFKNRIINGDFRVSQYLGTSSATPSTNNYYGIDRFALNGSQASKMTIQKNMGSITPPPNFSSYWGIQCAATATVGAGDYFNFQHRLEGLNFADLGWGTPYAKAVTLSFWVYTNFPGTYSGSFVQNYGSQRAYPFTFTVSSSTTWTYVTVTVPGDTSGTYATDNTLFTQLVFSLSTGSTYSGTPNAWAGSSSAYAGSGALTNFFSSTSNYIYFTGFQLEKGTQATSFDFRSYGTELALCQRYFISYGGSASYERFGTCLCSATTGSIAMMPFPVEMRAVPTFGYSSLANLGIYTGTSVITVTAVGGDSPSPKVGMLGLTVASGLTTGATYQFLANNTTSARATWSAEL